jgi:dTDP-4-amino-4,6-dideoxygalactose transaminase
MSYKKIFYGRQFIDKKDIASVSKTLKENLLTGGKYVEKFEKKIQKLFKSKYTISCSNGTAALFLAFKAIDLKPGDNVIIPAINFISSYSMAKEIGANVYLADVNKYTGQSDTKKILECIKKYKLKKVKAIILMYLGGYVENNIELNKLKKKMRCYIIEDACHAFGAKYLFKNKKYYIGSCRHSDISTFSFHPVKPITTGEGGLITTNSKKICEKIKLLRNHGIKRHANRYWDYDIPKLGFNFRLSDLNCSLGISQLKKLNDFKNKRQKLFKYYYKKAQKYKNFISIYEYKNSDNAYHLLIARINFVNLKSNKEELIKYFIKNNIMVHYHYIPIYRFSFFNKKSLKITYNGAEDFYKNAITLPLFFDLNLKKIDYIFQVFKNFINYKKI